MTRSTIAYDKAIPGVFQSFVAAHGKICSADLEPTLRHLIELRASQINRCAFCVDMHIDAAIKDGEDQARLNRLVVWRDVDDFSAAEKAALAWVEALTVLETKTDFDGLRTQLREHFSDSQIASITAATSMINLWNRMQVSNH